MYVLHCVVLRCTSLTGAMHVFNVLHCTSLFVPFDPSPVRHTPYEPSVPCAQCVLLTCTHTRPRRTGILGRIPPRSRNMSSVYGKYDQELRSAARHASLLSCPGARYALLGGGGAQAGCDMSREQSGTKGVRVVISVPSRR